LFHSFFLFLRGACFFGLFFVFFFPVVIGVLHMGIRLLSFLDKVFIVPVFWKH
jgi:hypothetical protein